MNLPGKNSGKKNYFKDFFKQWVDYLTIRKFKVDNEKNKITYEFPKTYGVEERHKFYTFVNILYLSFFIMDIFNLNKIIYEFKLQRNFF